jgi:hypothetical protein
LARQQVVFPVSLVQVSSFSPSSPLRMESSVGEYASSQNTKKTWKQKRKITLSGRQKNIDCEPIHPIPAKPKQSQQHHQQQHR